jgi:3-deoxy-manno-octulosonate cytidylyltransferase (CMP-KDO synthetase)
MLDEVVVATDDERIFSVVKNSGGKAILTSADHPTGTDRLIEVTGKYVNAQYIVNIQGDEPGIEPSLIDGVTKLKMDHPEWEMTTAACPIDQEADKIDPNRVKVVFDKYLKALYFSRSRIPSDFKFTANTWRHLGIYAYNRDFLLQYNQLQSSDLEKSESLEQLRALENGHTIGIYKTEKAGLSIDSPEDLEPVLKQFKSLGLIS